MIHELRATPDTCFWGFFDAALPAVLHVRSGDLVRIETLTPSLGRLRQGADHDLSDRCGFRAGASGLRVRLQDDRTLRRARDRHRAGSPGASACAGEYRRAAPTALRRRRCGAA